MNAGKVKLLMALLAVLIAGSTGAYATSGDVGSVKHISSKVINVGKPHVLHMVYGVGTALIFPGPVTGTIEGNAITYKLVRKEPGNLVALWLKQKGVPPTNLIILCGQQRIVFYVRPNSEKHQDVLEVIETYGSPEFEDEAEKLVVSGKL